MGVEYKPQGGKFPPARVWAPHEITPFETAFKPAFVKHVSDADTFDLGLDLGHDVKDLTIRIRLVHEGWLTDQRIGFNAWETRGAERSKGEAAKARVLELMPVDSMVLTRSWQGGERGSLNRWLHLVLVRVLFGQDGRPSISCPMDSSVSGWVSIADVLLHEGHGREWWKGWNQGAKRPGSD